MRPRFVFRTHYQVSEPAYLEFLIKFCTSPVRSSYREVVAKKLAVEIEKRCKVDNGTTKGIKGFNEKAGEYAVDLARALDLINQNHGWTDKGHLVDLIADVSNKTPHEEVELTAAEKILHFRIFLEGDGAAMLFLARYFLEKRRIDNIHSPDSINPLAQQMFVTVLTDYYSVTSAPTDRLKLRRYLESVKAKPFKGKGGTHKIKLHVQMLHRLGLLNSDGSSYEAERDGSGFETLLRMIPDVVRLDKTIDAKQAVEVAGDVLHLTRDSPRANVDDEILSLIVAYYRRMMENGVPLANLTTLIEASQIEGLATHAQRFSYATVESAIVRAQKRHPKDVRFHVDRRGRPAFIKLSPRFADSVSAAKTVP